MLEKNLNLLAKLPKIRKIIGAYPVVSEKILCDGKYF